jgi:hypothetical protein
MTVKVYDLRSPNGSLVQRYAGSNFEDDKVIDHCDDLFNSRSRRLSLYKDGKLIYRYFKLNKYNSPILDKTNGHIYKDVYEMCDNLNISTYKAFCIIKNKFQYEWVK